MATPFAELFEAAGQRYNINPRVLAAIAAVESGFNPRAKSPAGALGLMQIMPATARMLGVNPLDPAQAVDGGARYLRQMLDRYNGDLTLALAAYNAGPGNVDKAGGRVPRIPETQNYVARVKNAIASIARAYPGPRSSSTIAGIPGIPSRASSSGSSSVLSGVPVTYPEYKGGGPGDFYGGLLGGLGAPTVYDPGPPPAPSRVDLSGLADLARVPAFGEYGYTPVTYTVSDIPTPTPIDSAALSRQAVAVVDQATQPIPDYDKAFEVYRQRQQALLGERYGQIDAAAQSARTILGQAGSSAALAGVSPELNSRMMQGATGMLAERVQSARSDAEREAYSLAQRTLADFASTNYEGQVSLARNRPEMVVQALGILARVAQENLGAERDVYGSRVGERKDTAAAVNRALEEAGRDRRSEYEARAMRGNTLLNQMFDVRMADTRAANEFALAGYRSASEVAKNRSDASRKVFEVTAGAREKAYDLWLDSYNSYQQDRQFAFDVQKFNFESEDKIADNRRADAKLVLNAQSLKLREAELEYRKSGGGAASTDPVEQGRRDATRALSKQLALEEYYTKLGIPKNPQEVRQAEKTHSVISDIVAVHVNRGRTTAAPLDRIRSVISVGFREPDEQGNTGGGFGDWETVLNILASLAYREATREISPVEAQLELQDLFVKVARSPLIHQGEGRTAAERAKDRKRLEKQAIDTLQEFYDSMTGKGLTAAGKAVAFEAWAPWAMQEKKEAEAAQRARQRLQQVAEILRDPFGKKKKP